VTDFSDVLREKCLQCLVIRVSFELVVDVRNPSGYRTDFRLVLFREFEDFVDRALRTSHGCGSDRFRTFELLHRRVDKSFDVVVRSRLVALVHELLKHRVVIPRHNVSEHRSHVHVSHEFVHLRFWNRNADCLECRFFRTHSAFVERDCLFDKAFLFRLTGFHRCGKVRHDLAFVRDWYSGRADDVFRSGSFTVVAEELLDALGTHFLSVSRSFDSDIEVGTVSSWSCRDVSCVSDASDDVGFGELLSRLDVHGIKVRKSDFVSVVVPDDDRVTVHRVAHGTDDGSGKSGNRVTDFSVDIEAFESVVRASVSCDSSCSDGTQYASAFHRGDLFVHVELGQLVSSLDKCFSSSEVVDDSPFGILLLRHERKVQLIGDGSDYVCG